MYSNSLESLSSRIVFFSSCVNGLGGVFMYIDICVCVFIVVLVAGRAIGSPRGGAPAEARCASGLGF